jgi:hypothetical protein
MLLSLLFALFFSFFAQSAYVETMHCEPIENSGHECKISLKGKITKGEKLFLPYAQDIDQLKFENWALGETGYLLSYPYAASQFPRIYSLQPLEGKEGANLTLRTSAYFPESKKPPSKVKVIDENFPLRKVYTSLLLKMIFFLALVTTTFALLVRLRRQTIDGWIYPLEELRISVGSTCCYLLLNSEWTHAGVPSLWSASFHHFSLDLCQSISIWAAGSLLLGARFFDRSCIERVSNKTISNIHLKLLDAGFLLSLFLILPPFSGKNDLFLIPVILPATLAILSSSKNMEWRRILKRSGKSPLFFHFSLLIFSATNGLFFLLSLISEISFKKEFFYSSLLLIFSGAWRLQRLYAAKNRGRYLYLECKDLLSKRSGGLERLKALCEFLEDEWAAARVSILSIDENRGLLLASAGPEAIAATEQSKSRKLGPFLKRVCREGHLLYAPVAEELGKELQEQGMRHSSLAFPFFLDGKVRAILCLMADEGERIPAMEVTIIEMLLKDLELEILSAVSQQVAEEKCKRLLALARDVDGLAVEHLDAWGYLVYQNKDDRRMYLGLKLEKNPLISKSARLERLYKDLQRELTNQWLALAQSFEYVVKESKNDFWAVSPANYHSDYLKSIGGERTGFLFASLLARFTKNTLNKPCYSALAFPEFRLAIGYVQIRIQASGNNQRTSIEIDSEDQSTIYSLREQSNSEILWVHEKEGNEPTVEGFTVHLSPFAVSMDQYLINTILSVSGNKKELRKMELKVIEILKEQKRVA